LTGVEADDDELDPVAVEDDVDLREGDVAVIA
jgi:hypothetical protein